MCAGVGAAGGEKCRLGTDPATSHDGEVSARRPKPAFGRGAGGGPEGGDGGRRGGSLSGVFCRSLSASHAAAAAEGETWQWDRARPARGVGDAGRESRGMV